MAKQSAFQKLWVGMLCSTSVLAAIPSAMAQPAPTQPFAPLSAPATHRILPGKIVFSMLVTPDLTKAQVFYSRLFGWSFRAVGDGKTPRVEILSGTQPIGAMVAHALRHPDRDTPFWMPFISTSDTATVARVTRQQGGKVLFGPRQIDGLGQMVIVSDPQHGIYAALSALAGDPADQPGSPALNSWSWATLLAPNPGQEAGYYQLLFNYKVMAAPEADNGSHYIIASQDKERASLNTLPNGVTQKDRARWVQFVQVQDTADAANRATALGGQVIVPPHVDRDGAIVAILADPSGAVFGVIEAQKDILEMGAPQ